MILALLLLAAVPAGDGLESQIKRFVDVYALVEREAADEVPPEKGFYEGAIPGMLRRLDPHSVFFDPRQFEQLRELETSTRKGFGTVVSVTPGRVIVLQTFTGTPSARSGMAPGDEILAVNGFRLDRLDQEQLIELLGASRQREARLDVRRPGNARILQFVLVPEELQAPSVERAFLLKPGVGYVRVGSFDAQTGAQIRQAIEKLGGAGLKGLLLDLRNNPGGLLPQAVETAALFLKPGQKVLSVRGRAAEAKDVVVPENSTPYAFPLAVLINSKSASAAEVVAGALQDHRRAVIVGEPSFGKGLVQSVYPLSSGTGLALTTAFYHTPNGRSIQRPLRGGQLDAATARPEGSGGIQPDREVHPEAVTRLRMAVEASGLFTAFATEFVRQHPSLDDSFDVSPAVLDDFQVFASERNIRPGMDEWSRELDWMRSRLRTEIFNQSLGVEKGDEVEARRDPQVLAALEAIAAT